MSQDVDKEVLDVATEHMFWASVDKVGSGDEWRFRIIASTDSIDKEGEVIDPAAIRKLKNVERVPFCVAESHVTARLCPVTQIGWFYPDKETPDNVYAGEVVLFKGHSLAQDYWVVLKENPEDQKSSIAGTLKAATRMGRPTRILDMEIDHILGCRANAAANPDTRVLFDYDMRKAVFKAAAYGATACQPIPEVSTVDDELHWDESEEAMSLLEQGTYESLGEVSKAEIEVSYKPWDVTGYAKRLPAECFLYVPDKERRSSWKFPVYEGRNPDKDGNFQERGPLNWNALRNAAARIVAIKNRLRRGETFVTMSRAEAEELVREVAPKIVALYKKLGRPVPESLEKTDTREGDGIVSKLVEALKRLVNKAETGDLDSEPVTDTDSAADNAVDTAPAEPAEPAAAQEPVAQEPAQDVPSADAAPNISAEIEAVRQEIAALKEVIGALSQSEPEKTEKTQGTDAPEAPVSDADKTETEQIAQLLREMLEPVIGEVASLKEAVGKLLERRGMSLQVGKAAADAARDPSVGTLVPTEGGLEELKQGLVRAAKIFS